MAKNEKPGVPWVDIDLVPPKDRAKVLKDLAKEGCTKAHLVRRSSDSEGRETTVVVQEVDLDSL